MRVDVVSLSSGGGFSKLRAPTCQHSSSLTGHLDHWRQRCLGLNIFNGMADVICAFACVGKASSECCARTWRQLHDERDEVQERAQILKAYANNKTTSENGFVHSLALESGTIA
jgi:hypothetical protein